MIMWKRSMLAIAAVACLSIPSAVGVHHALLPTRGPIAAWLAAAGFELVYLSITALALRRDLQRYAGRVARAAVATAVMLNTLADYAMRVPDGLASWAAFRQTFDPLALGLSIIESLPLAALAYALATLIHRLSEDPEPVAPAAEPVAPAAEPVAPAADLALPRQAAYPEPVKVEHAAQAVRTACKPGTFQCPACGARLSQGQYGAAVKHGHCRHCKHG